VGGVIANDLVEVLATFGVSGSGSGCGSGFAPFGGGVRRCFLGDAPGDAPGDARGFRFVDAGEESPPYMIERTWLRERPPLLSLSSHLNSKDGLCFSDSKYARRNEKSSVENFVASATAFLNARLLAKFSETVVMSVEL